MYKSLNNLYSSKTYLSVTLWALTIVKATRFEMKNVFFFYLPSGVHTAMLEDIFKNKYVTALLFHKIQFSPEILIQFRKKGLPRYILL